MDEELTAEELRSKIYWDEIDMRDCHGETYRPFER